MAESLFEVGQWYEFKRSDHEGIWTSTEQVVAVEGALVKLKGLHGSGDEIVNTAAPQFVSAQHQPAKAGA